MGKARTPHSAIWLWITLACILPSLCGCQSLSYWWHNDKKVGPNYCRPSAPVAEDYSDADKSVVDTSQVVDTQWWHVFHDSDLNLLVQLAYEQNLSLKAAAWRIAEARSIRNIAAANLFPQSQTAFSQYAHTQNSLNAGAAFPGFPVTIDDWSVGFDAGWEIDLWGRIRRNIAAADAQLCATVKDYDFAIVSLVSEVAAVYIQVRSLDERLVLAQQNVTLQKGSLDLATKRFDEGRTSKLDVVQAESNLAATQALVPQLELARRQTLNALALLLGQTPNSFSEFPSGRIPRVPSEIIVGIPAELLQRRPDIQSAERLMAAQFEQIGIAEANLYPTFSLGGTLGLQAAKFSDLFDGKSFTGSIAPAFRWNVLNYGRLRENIRVEEARFRQIQYDFQNSVLAAQREVEDGIVEFIKSSEQYEFAEKLANANDEAVELAKASYKEGQTDFGRVFVVESGLVQSQDQLVSVKANIALALVKTYKALGGGWEVRCFGGPSDFETLDPTLPVEVISSDLSETELNETELHALPTAMRETKLGFTESAENFAESRQAALPTGRQSSPLIYADSSSRKTSSSSPGTHASHSSAIGTPNNSPPVSNLAP